MAIPTAIEALSTTAASNGPAGSEQRTLADDGLRQAYAFIRQLVSSGSNIASASTITPPSTGSFFTITGTTTITAISSNNSWNGRRILLTFADAVPLTHSSNLQLQGALSFTTGASDILEFVQTASGTWREVRRMDYSEAPPAAGTYTPTLTGVTNVAASTAFTTQYMRVGSVVTVSGGLQIDPTSGSTLTELGVSLPVSSDLASFRQLSGSCHTTDGVITGVVIGDATNNRAQLSCTPTSAANADWMFHFTYLVV